MGKGYVPGTEQLRKQFEENKRYYKFSSMPDLSPELELFEAKLWIDWIAQGNDPGDQLEKVILSEQPLAYWISEYKRRYNNGDR